jgi:two-component system, OmpR family, response regulator
MKILLLEDELMLQSSIYEYLDTLGYKVNCFSDGKDANEELLHNEYDLLILDINVPNINGLKIIKNLHQNKTFTPTIFISAAVDIDTISTAFELGAIDYLKKPFHLKELELRIQKEMLNKKNEKSKHITLSKNYAIDLETNTLYYNKEAQQLTNKKLQIIRYLSINIGVVITIDILREYIWNNEPVSDATIRTEVSRLKKILHEEFIKNIKGVGYIIDRISLSS